MSKATKDNWRETVSFLAPPSETHQVGGQDYKFYPVSVSVMFKLRNVAKPLAQALRALFAQGGADQTRRQVGDAGEILAISPELAKLRSDQAEKALADLIEAFTKDENAMLLGELLVDSLRDTFERGSMDPASCLAFIRAMDVATLTDMLVGLAKGNRRILGPFGEILSETIARYTLQLASVAQSLRAQPKGPETPPNS